MSQPVQERYEDSNLYRIRHSTAHIMAQAVLEMFPDGKITIGPPIENGFYYDFDLPRNLTPEDLEKIEKRMRQIIAERLTESYTHAPHFFVTVAVDVTELESLRAELKAAYEVRRRLRSQVANRALSPRSTAP